MIGVFHGYSLEGSGSNLWTRYMIQALCRQGETVHLLCQEKTPEKYDFVAEAFYYSSDGAGQKLFSRNVPYPGRCILHRPQLGEVLPVYVGRFLAGEPPMLPMNELPDQTIHDYIDRNYRIARKVVSKHGIRVLHVNHAILMSQVAERIHTEQSIPYAVMPHGSEIEYVIRKDPRFLDLALPSLKGAGRVFVISPEMRQRVTQVFSAVAGLNDKIVDLRLGVDTNLFEVVAHQDRVKEMEKFFGAAASISRGKSPELTQRMLAGLEETISAEKMKELFHVAREYPGRQPDADLEQKLKCVDWQNDSIVLYTGRLISGKGTHLLLAALPLIFDKHPSARLILAGHGPLREGLEAFLQALKNGNIQLVNQIIQWGTYLEDGGSNSFIHIQKFYEALQREGKLKNYFETARAVLRPDRIVFTGYLKHDLLRHIFSCSDVAVFPSIVPEAGPLVFLEALASGCFPIATDFAGAAGMIDLVSRNLASPDSELMKIRPEQEFAIFDIAEHVSAALALAGKHQKRLRDIGVHNYDWQNIAREWKQELRTIENS